MIGIRTLGCWNEEGKVQTNPLSFGGKTVVTTFGIVAIQIKRTYIKSCLGVGCHFGSMHCRRHRQGKQFANFGVAKSLVLLRDTPN